MKRCFMLTEEKLESYYEKDYSIEETKEGARELYQELKAEVPKKRENCSLRIYLSSLYINIEKYRLCYALDYKEAQRILIKQKIEDYLFEDFDLPYGYDPYLIRWMQKRKTFIQEGNKMTKQILTETKRAWIRPTMEKVVPVIAMSMFKDRYYSSYLTYEQTMAEYTESPYYTGVAYPIAVEEEHHLQKIKEQFFKISSN